MRHSRLIKWVILSLPMLTALVVYGYTLGLPFFWDDGPQFELLETSNGLDMWFGNADYLYYRPAVFVFWKISAVLAGFYDAVGLHWLNVILFALAGAVLGRIAYRLMPQGGKLLSAIVVGNGFVLFPQSYQAVTWIGSMFHTALAFCLAMTVWCGLIWLKNGARWAFIVGVFMAFWGIFSHESGVVIPVIMGIIGLVAYFPVIRQPIMVRRFAFYILPMVISAIAFVVAYLVVPRDASPGRLRPLLDMVESSATLGGNFFYPLVALIRPLIEGTPAAVPMVIGVALATITMLVLIVTLGKHRILIGLCGAGIVWFWVVLSPSILLLDQFYVSGSPRILLVPSMGAVLAWGALSVVLWHRGWWGRVLVIAFVGVAVWVSVGFLNTQRYFFTLQNTYANRLFTLVQGQPDPSVPTVLVNAPDYVIPLEENRAFLRGTEGAALMIFTVDYADYLWINSGVRLPNLRVVRYGILNQAQGISVYLHDPEVDEFSLAQIARSGVHVYVTQFEGASFLPIYVGGDIDGANAPRFTFGDDQLHITELGAVYLSTEGRLRVHVRWRVDVPQFVQPFVHVFCDRERIGQFDASPWAGTYPFHLWDVGEAQTDLREIPLMRPYTPDCHALLGVYRLEDVSRLPIIDVITGETLPDALIPIPYFGESTDPRWILKP